MIEINGENDDYVISGYIGYPEIAKTSRNVITTLVNGRVIKNLDLNRCLIDCYHTYIPKDKFPMIVLNIDGDKTSSIVTGPFQFDLKLFSSFLITNDSGQLYNEMLSHPVIQGVSKEQVITSFETTLSIVNENRQLLDSAYDNIQPTLEKITQTCIEKKKRKKLW